MALYEGFDEPGYLRLKGEAAKLRGRNIRCSFGEESTTIDNKTTFLVVRRSAFGETWQRRGNVSKPTLKLSDGATETEVSVDALLLGEASVVEAALDDAVKFWVEYVPDPKMEPRRGDVVELEPWAHGGDVVLRNNDGPELTVDACADGLMRVTWPNRPPARPWAPSSLVHDDDDILWQCNITLPRSALRVARRDSWAEAAGRLVTRPAAALRDTETGRRLAPVADDVATALAPAVATARLAWRSVAAAATAAASGNGGAPGPYA